ncbi:MAG: DMT family transporter [Vicinamibacteria bacterium]|nr:DMT family transporter [Vicinamibacteria bacterium]
MLVSAAVFSCASAAIKTANEQTTNAMVVFFRNLVGVFVLAPWAIGAGRTGLATRRLHDHLLRGLLGVSAMYCTFFSIGRMRLADALALGYSSPFFLPWIERFWLGEPVPRRIFGGLVFGFAGILLIVKPGLSAFQPVALVALAGAVLGAFAQAGVRRLTASEPVARIVLFFALTGTTISAFPLLFSWQAPSMRTLTTLMLVGLLATVAQLFFTSAYGQAPASNVAPFLYGSVIFSGVLDFLLWGKLPDALSIVGAMMIVLAGVVILRRLSDGVD